MLASRCAAWTARFPSERPPPGRDWLLVFLAGSEGEARAAAAEAAAAGFERGLILEGGLPAYGQAAHAQARHQFAGTAGKCSLIRACGLADLRCIGRDVVAVLLSTAFRALKVIHVQTSGLEVL